MKHNLSILEEQNLIHFNTQLRPTDKGNLIKISDQLVKISN
jgi:hypothetical protein